MSVLTFRVLECTDPNDPRLKPLGSSNAEPLPEALSTLKHQGQTLATPG